MRWPPFQVVPYGSWFMVRCADCGDVQQVDTTEHGRQVGRDHQRYDHPTDEEREADELREAESRLEDYCGRCGQEGHRDAECPNVQPWMLKGRDPMPDAARWRPPKN